MDEKDLHNNSRSDELDFLKSYNGDSKKLELTNKHGFPKRLDKEYVKKLPINSFKGVIHLIDKKEDIGEAIKILRQEKVLGFDTETRPNFQKGQKNMVSLLQLSTPRDAYLFRLNLIGFPYELSSLLGDKSILKVGVAILDDIRALQKLRKFEPESFVELSSIGNQLGIITCGLQNLAAIFLGVRITKKERLTNWERSKFKESQSLYAATDAWICLEIFIFLKIKKLLPKKIIWKMPNLKLSKKSTNYIKKNIKGDY